MKKYWFEPCGGGARIAIRPDVNVYIDAVYDINLGDGDIYCYMAVEEITDPDAPFDDGKILAEYEHCSECEGGDTTIVITEDDNNILATRAMTMDEPLLAVSLDMIITDGSVEYKLWGYSIPLTQNYVGGFLDVNQEGTMDWMPNFPELAVNNKYKVETTGSNIEVLLPVLFNWRSFQSLPTLAAIFGQNATKNWRWYQENGWQIKAKISTLTDVGSYIDEVDFEVRDYDDNSEVDWTWEMFRESTLDPITSPIAGEKAIVKVTADMPNNTTEAIDYATVTVEGFEQPIRWLISSVYEHLNQSSSPLQPVQYEDRLKLTNVTGTNNSVELEFIFDASKISNNKVKFTGRIYQQGGGDYTERNVQTFDIPFLPPEQKEPEYEAEGCCDCPSELKLASLTSDDLRENDITGVVHKNQTSSDICTFEIYKNGELLPNNGVDYPNGFPHDDKVSAFVYNWKYYLANYGVGCYEIKKTFTIAGLDFERSVGNYELKEYTPQNAKGTARVLYQNSFETLFDDQIINFDSSGFEDSYRFQGFFGKWQPNVISESDFSATNENRVSSIKSKDNYRLIISGAGECEIKRIHKIVMSAAVWRMSDHNPSNALQDPIIYECVLDKENSEEITYHDGSKISDVEIILSKRQQNSVSLFNGSLQLVQGATWLLPTVTGGGGTCADATVNIVDSNGNPIGSVTVPSGGSDTFVVADLPCAVDSKEFIMEVESDGNGEFTIPTTGGGYNYHVKTSDGQVFSSVTGDLTITFPSANTDYIIEISGDFPRIYFANGSERLKAKDIKQWGDIVWGSMNRSFYGCSNLIISANDTPDLSSVTNMGNMFSNCSSLTTLDVSNWDVSSVTNMGSMFYNCQSLSSLDVSNWDVSSVTNMGSMFSNCSSLTTLDVSNWDVSNVTNMSYMFQNCQSLSSLDVSGWDVSSVTNMQNMFSQCEVLTTLDVSLWDVSSVTNMNRMFTNCSSLIIPIDWSDPITGSVSVQNIQYFAYNTKIPSIKMQCGSVTSTDSFSFRTITINELNAINLKNSVWINYSPLLTGVAIDNLANSVANLTSLPSATITMTTAQRNSGIDETIWTNKNWQIAEV